MSFARPGMLALAAVLPLLVALGFVLHVRRRRRAARAWADVGLVERLGGSELHRVPWLRAGCVVLAAGALGMAAAGPGWGREEARAPAAARDVVLVLDASNSMLAADVQPNRLELQRAAARALIQAFAADRIGLVVFAGRGYILSPLTTDHRALWLNIDALGPSIVAQGGSSLEAALRQALSLLVAARGGRTIVLISDGEALDERGAVLDLAERAGRAGVIIHTLGVGTPGGAPVPDMDPVSGVRRGYKREPDGRVAISRADPELLHGIASRARGSHHMLAGAAVPPELVAAIRATPGAGGAGGGPPRRADRAAWFVGAALLLVGVDALLDRRARR
ncbi:MAG: VWA domain-containing protein [Gemmatimonadota bacterium]|nr:VWA domain-containing protein [Gemmatimonadota bacterium]